MEIKDIREQIERYQADGKKLFTTSSFQTHSIPMLHIISLIDRSIPVYFINTGYLFPETIAFRDEVVSLLGLTIVDLKSDIPKSMQRNAVGKLMFTNDPDYCCFMNKTQPMQAILAKHDVWINGVRGDQSSVRKAMKVEQKAPFNSIRFHPMLDWSKQQIYAYIRENQLPKHPLDALGYTSIGCEPCTRKMDLEMQEREARWFGLNKVECGLHTDLIK